MEIWLEDRIRNALLALRFKRVGDRIHPGYFLGTSPEPLRFEETAAAFLASFITKRVVNDEDNYQHAGVTEDLDKYSPEVIATYLEDQGYVVTSPDP